MLNNRLDPLSIVVPIVDKQGRPTLEFQRKWQQQIAANATIPDLSKISVLAGSGLTGGGPLTASVTLAADVQAVLNQLAASQGTLVYRGASKWEILTPGTDAQVLTTHGAAANPTWEDAAPTVPALTDGHILVGNGSNLAADVVMSGDATIDNTGAVSVHSADGVTFNAAGPTFSRTGGGTILLAQGEGLVNNTASTFGSTSSNARFSLRMARGTIASPTALSLNDITGVVYWQGYGGTAYQNVAKIQATVIEATPSDTAMGSRLGVFIPAIGAVSFTEVLRLEAAKQTFLGPVGVGSLTTVPDASAILDMRSTTKGVLSPRMTTTQRNAISTPADGLEVYDTTLHAKFVNYNGVWTQLGAGASGANPTAQVGPAAINGSASTFMRSDAAPKLADTTVTPAAYGDSTHYATFTVDQQGRLTAAGQTSLPAGANPAATGSDTATNGVATTFMRSDASFAIQKTSSSQFGLAKVDGTTIVESGGVISASGFVPLAAAFHPGFASGRKYTKPMIATISTVGMTANVLYAMPFFVPKTCTLTKLIISVTAFVAGKSIELGIYNNLDGVPTSLLLDAGAVSAGANGDISATISQILTPGWYWLVAGSDGTPTVRGDTAAALPSGLFGVSATNGSINDIHGSWTFSAGGLPGTFPAISYGSSTTPLIWAST